MVSGGHRSGKVAKHQCCHGGTWYVILEEEEMEKSLGEHYRCCGKNIQDGLIVMSQWGRVSSEHVTGHNSLN